MDNVKVLENAKCIISNYINQLEKDIDNEIEICKAIGIPRDGLYNIITDALYNTEALVAKIMEMRMEVSKRCIKSEERCSLDCPFLIVDICRKYNEYLRYDGDDYYRCQACIDDTSDI